jgi:molybdopterin-guanine dinucleotide biosynthesis protein A
MIRSINTRYVPVEELRRFDPQLRTFTNINKIEELDRINAMAGQKPGPGDHAKGQKSPDRTSQ